MALGNAGVERLLQRGLPRHAVLEPLQSLGPVFDPPRFARPQVGRRRSPVGHKPVGIGARIATRLPLLRPDLPQLARSSLLQIPYWVGAAVQHDPQILGRIGPDPVERDRGCVQFAHHDRQLPRILAHPLGCQEQLSVAFQRPVEREARVLQPDGVSCMATLDHVERRGLVAGISGDVPFDLVPVVEVWGLGTTASADGQFYPAARQGEAMNTVNARYGNDPGIEAYTHVNDRFAPFASQPIPATVSEAPSLLDGLTMNEAGRRIEEQYADTGGFTDHLFGISAMLGYRLVLRIRDLPSKRLYVFDPTATPTELRPLVGSKAREALIVSNWPGLFRCASTMSAGQIAPSRILRKLAAYPRQNDLATALREVGRIERTLFIIEWIFDTGMQRRAQVGLNKGEAHHVLKNALHIGRQGDIRDRTTEGQHYRIAGLNLLTAIIVY